MTDPAPTGFDRLWEAIVRGDIAPGSRLVEADLAATFSMSRGDVRNALIRLEQADLVVREVNRGARVREIGDEEAVEILEARAVLEGLAVRHAAMRCGPEDAERLRGVLARQGELVAAQDLLGASEVNAELHAALLALSGHQTARRLIRGLRSQTVRFQFRTILVPGRPAGSHEEHARVVDAVIDADADAAEQAMRTHLLNVAEALRSQSVTYARRSGTWAP